jgi:hypothetical protein
MHCPLMWFVKKLTVLLVTHSFKIGSDLIFTSLLFSNKVASEYLQFPMYAYSVMPRMGHCPPLPPLGLLACVAGLA